MIDSTAHLIEFLIQDLAVVLIAAGLSGWLCKRLGISVVVGYLAAGILVGTPQITFPYVTDAGRIQLLAQLGLIFLMFSIGLGLGLRKIKQIGFGVVLATAATALLVLMLSRTAAMLLGVNEGTALFLGAMIMGSSSAIVGKLIYDSQLAHQRSGQLALAMSLLEDIVAIVMLTYLSSYAAMEQSSSGGLGAIVTQVSLLLVFVVIIVLPGIAVLPRWLRRFEKIGGVELETLIVAGILFGLSWLTLSAGFSIALGAFLFGVILAETTRAQVIEKAFSGLKDIFVAVFFTATGMAIDILRLPEALGLIALGVVLALLVRPIAATFGFLLACEDEKVAVKAALCVTPIGEFAFVIAGLGVAAGVLEEKIQVAAVGIAFVTSLCSPLVAKQGDRLSQLLRPSRIRWLGRCLSLYQSSWSKVSQHSDRSVLWKILRPRVWQISAEWLLVTGVLLFAHPLEPKFTEWMESNLAWLPLASLIYRLAIALIVLAPVIALYRNISAVAMILADGVPIKACKTPENRHRLELVFQLTGLLLLTVWLLFLFSFGSMRIGDWLLFALLLSLAAIGGWRKWVRWHSHAEFSIKSALAEEVEEDSRVDHLSKKMGNELGLDLFETEVPVRSIVVGQSLGQLNLRRRFDVSVIAIDRQGFLISDLAASEKLYARDHIYMVGSTERLKDAIKMIQEVAPDKNEHDLHLQSAILSKVVVSESSSWTGRTLDELDWPNRFGLQIVGIQRAGQLQSNFKADEHLQVGDELTLAGSSSAVKALNAAEEE
ncbi:cation:proton antiporter [Coraliomargarita sp. SDUM461004]|uniref:Cation:proton antiporter n=1 Tax=Thalassobacterium sedimentorum TaxID=3041258 RepID=A0ABU1AML4_9BACT|nr:cation:proton antiporter [Coraliomargarita sp. SDUM461004]MDQ8196047.1 cation:proton antiporter [Coraliomargarita sp. SDUM461004]